MTCELRWNRWMLTLVLALMCNPSLVAAEDPAATSSPITQKENAAGPGEVQERAIRQSGAPGATDSCRCLRPAGQCVFSAQGGCVPHPGNPCNGGCVSANPQAGVGGQSAAPGMSPSSGTFNSGSAPARR